MDCLLLRDAEYELTLGRQREVFDAMVERARHGLPTADLETLMLVEHLPVYTLGRHGHEANLIHPDRLGDARLVHIDRGGDITYHGPGQLVAYPIVDLGRRGLGVKDYVNMLEEAVITTIAHYGIAGRRVEGATGVWIDPDVRPRKICAIGIRCSRFIAMHGLALNVSTDLSRFSVINPCGFTDRGVTSIERECGSAVAFEEVADLMRGHLLRLFGA